MEDEFNDGLKAFSGSRSRDASSMRDCDRSSVGRRVGDGRRKAGSITTVGEIVGDVVNADKEELKQLEAQVKAPTMIETRSGDDYDCGLGQTQKTHSNNYKKRKLRVLVNRLIETNCTEASMAFAGPFGGSG